MQTVSGKILFSAAFVIGTAAWIVNISRHYFSVRLPDNEHPYGIRSKGGTDLFFTPRLGWFLDHAIWICFALLIALVAVEWFGQRRHRGVSDHNA